MGGSKRLAGLILVLLMAIPATAGAREPVVEGGSVTDGDVRFAAITPTLVRFEHAPGGRFEDRPTLLAVNRSPAGTELQVSVEGERLTVDTGRIRISYRRDSGPFSDENLDVTITGEQGPIDARPSWDGPYTPPPESSGPGGYFGNRPDSSSFSTPGNLGGWARGLDNHDDAFDLGDGLLSRDGWYFIDDSTSVVLRDRGRDFANRDTPDGYQDGYLFGYGLDYETALADYRVLSGPAPLLPRKAFGVWFSRFAPFSEQDYREELIPSFREERVPLDVLIVDTDFKAPHPWAGWQWRESLFPDPRRFLEYAHGEGLDVSLNVHPSIAVDDPAYPETLATAGGALPPSIGGQTFNAAISPGDAAVPHSTFDWGEQDDLEAYFDLHDPFDADGNDFWWLDFCCEEARTDGLVGTGEVADDTWINSQYALREIGQGSRWPTLSRIGASFNDWTGAQPGPWGAHRSAIHFTGDAISSWEMLDFQTRFTAAEGAIGVPYVSHDIGGFGNGLAGGFGGQGEKLSDELYVRWVQSGTVQPILRLHSSSSGDPRRLPWEFEGKARKIAARFLRLREKLIPYMYTAAERSFRTGMPIARSMFLEWPELDEAYEFDRQYMLGDELLAAPVGSEGDPATKKIWFPPGTWTDIFTGESYRGPSVETLEVPLARMPLFARGGGIVPLAPYSDYSTQKPLKKLRLRLYPGANGASKLYEDAGDGLAYQTGESARTPFRYKPERGKLRIGPPRGSFPGMLKRRSYVIEVFGIDRRPRQVKAGGKKLKLFNGKAQGWTYAKKKDKLVVRVKTRTDRRLLIRYR